MLETLAAVQFVATHDEFGGPGKLEDTDEVSGLNCAVEAGRSKRSVRCDASWGPLIIVSGSREDFSFISNNDSLSNDWRCRLVW